jgi:hypothetical protein
MRYLQNPRTLWIDAICINQDLVKEQNSQVAITGSIYRNAKKVMIWIGKSGDGSDTAMDTISQADKAVFLIRDPFPTEFVGPENHLAIAALISRLLE